MIRLEYLRCLDRLNICPLWIAAKRLVLDLEEGRPICADHENPRRLSDAIHQGLFCQASVVTVSLWWEHHQLQLLVLKENRLRAHGALVPDGSKNDHHTRTGILLLCICNTSI